MLHVAITVAAFVWAGGDYSERPRNPVAPSLPLLSEKENAKLEAVVDRFIQLEIGKLPKAEEQKAKDELYRLGPEAIFALVDGFNRALKLESSCATVTIGKKIETIVRGSEDQNLISYVRENLGAGNERNGKGSLPATNALRNVQTTCLLRKGELLRRGITATTRPAPNLPSLSGLSMSELESFAGKVRGDQLKKVLREVEKRQGFETLAILGKAAATGPDPDDRKFAKALLAEDLNKRSATELQTLLKHTHPEVRAAAVRTVASKKLRYGDELIASLSDTDPGVRNAAHTALVQLADGSDFGPRPGANATDRAAAIARWRQWWQAR